MCNYDETATDEGSCTYVEDNFDCDGECIVDVDCNGVQMVIQCQMLVIIVIGCSDDGVAAPCGEIPLMMSQVGNCYGNYYDCNGVPWRNSCI